MSVHFSSVSRENSSFIKLWEK